MTTISPRMSVSAAEGDDQRRASRRSRRSSPLIAPMAPPTQDRAARTRAAPACGSRRSPASTAVRPSTEPIERSMLPVMIRIAVPTPAMRDERHVHRQHLDVVHAPEEAAVQPGGDEQRDQHDQDADGLRLAAHEPADERAGAARRRLRRASRRRRVGRALIARVPIRPPVMWPTTSSGVVSLAGVSSTTRPSLSTTIRSATAKTSSMLWLITITPIPRLGDRADHLERAVVWWTPSAAVGSSSIITLLALHHRPGDRDRLALAAREPAHRHVEVGDPDADLVEPLLRDPGRLALVERPRSGRAGSARAPGRARRWRPRRGCRRARDPGGRSRSPSVARRGGVRCSSFSLAEPDLAGVGLVDPAQRLDQRALAGAVVADERDDLAGVHRQRDAGERLDAAEPLDDALAADSHGRLPARLRAGRRSRGYQRSRLTHRDSERPSDAREASVTPRSACTLTARAEPVPVADRRVEVLEVLA